MCLKAFTLALTKQRFSRVPPRGSWTRDGTFSVYWNSIWEPLKHISGPPFPDSAKRMVPSFFGASLLSMDALPLRNTLTSKGTSLPLVITV